MSTDAVLETTEESSLAGNVLRWIGFGLFFLTALICFTLVKVPQSKIHGWILGTLNQQMNPMGMTISADEGKIALGMGLHYEMSGVRITKIMNQKSLRFSRLQVAPAFLSLLQGKLGGTFSLEEGSGVISGSFLTRGEDFESTVDIQNLNLGRMGVLPTLADVEGTADIKGAIEIMGTMNQPSSFNGKIDLNLAKIIIDNQKISGFQIPRTAITDGVINISIGAGKATFNSFRLGKAGGTDDMNGTISGDIKLMKIIDSSEANLKVKFGFSDRYRLEKTISLMDSLLGMFKLPDSSFAMKLVGPLYSIQPTPDQ